MTQAQRKAHLEDQRQRSQQHCAIETEAQRQVCLLELSEDHERASESEEQRAQRNERLRKYRRQISTNEPHPAPTPESVHQQTLLRRDLEKFQKELRLSPTSVCCTCESLWYPKLVVGDTGQNGFDPIPIDISPYKEY